MIRSLAAVSILAALALALAACGTVTEPSQSPLGAPVPSAAASQAPSESPGPSTAPTPPDVTYEAATVPATENSTAATIIVPGGDGLISIGFDGGFGSILWTSGDEGRTWTDITPAEFASIGIASVVEFDGMLVGVGRGDTIDVDAQEAAVYLSEDGVTWRKVTKAEDMVGQLIDVVATDDGLFAVGGVVGADAAGIWHSTDAETWERIGGDFPASFMWTIAEGGPGLIAAGWRRNPDPDLTIWTSADAGATWEMAPDPEGFAGVEATDIAALPDGSLAMVGSFFDGSGGRIWHSTDGTEWSLVVDDLGDGAWARSLALTPIGLVAAGSGGELRGVAWVSTDGFTWSPLGEPIEGAFLTGIHPTDDGILFSGATQAGTLATGIQAHAAIWIATFD
jgi:hypothetical protein